MEEPISGKKFVKSYVEWKPWIKTIRFGSGLFIILFILFTLYRAYFMKTDKQEVTIGTVEEGATVVIERAKKEEKRVGVNFFVTSKDAGAIFFKDIGSSWRAGLGAEYDFDHKEVMPRVELEWFW